MGFATLFETIKTLGHDQDFNPKPSKLFFPTMYGPGSEQKIEVMRQRVELGLPLWHPQDEQVCDVVGVGEGKKSQQCIHGRRTPFFASRLHKMLSE